MTGSDLSMRRLHTITAKSKNDGPTVWLTGCLHGDEVGGIVVIQEIFKKIRRKPLLRGSLMSFPLMNPMGFEMATRHVAVTDDDLNRSFPGDKNGSLAQRIAHKIFSTIIKSEPTLVLDLHNDWRKSIPYAILDPYMGINYVEVYEKIRMFCQVSGLVMVRETTASYTEEDLSTTLSGSLVLRNIPAITLELGEASFVNEENVSYGIKAIWNILSFLEMVEPDEEFSYPVDREIKGKILKYSEEPKVSQTGIVRFLVKPKMLVRKGQPLANVYNIYGDLEETLFATADGIVLCISDTSVAFPGTSVISMGII